MLTVEVIAERFQLTARNHARLMREINRGVMERQAKRLGNHFEESAFAEYGARPRNPEYERSKVRKYGHRKPLVKRGRLKRAVLSRIKITATQYGSRLVTRGSSRSPLHDWQKREIAVISKNEIQQERRRQASEYKRGATGKYARKRKRRIS